MKTSGKPLLNYFEEGAERRGEKKRGEERRKEEERVARKEGGKRGEECVLPTPHVCGRPLRPGEL